MTYSLPIVVKDKYWRVAPYWKNFLEIENVEDRIGPANAVLCNYSAELTSAKTGHLIIFKREEDKTFFLLKYS